MSENLSSKPVLVKKFTETKKINMKLILVVLVTVILGIGSGYLLSSKKGTASTGGALNSVKEGEAISAGTTVGISDEKTFRDSAEGKLVKGGIDGEGSHHLERGLDKSQYVYLTSSTVDLDKYVDRTVKIWGETFSAQSAGWLMDVGKLKVLE